MRLLGNALLALARGLAYVAGLCNAGERSHYIGFNSNGEIDHEIDAINDAINEAEAWR